ncbi:TniB family NTP-binding protein [uncultured Tateyamaria sp.]|uniref:TniB family NTP-binding protein n=1 Tax=Tateyamaria sp. 1078 TaxID=3417464 RepID=UPI00260D2E0C|nr:TniB family NTP-binding protein [uncultured Tateyamaria sp.]
MTQSYNIEKIVGLKKLYYTRETHEHLRDQFDRLLNSRREELRQGITREGRAIALLGPSGSGKTTAVERLLYRHPELVLPEPDQERADVISFRVPSPATLKDVGMTALDALGYPLSRDRPAGIIWAMVREFLKKRQTLFLHIDEAQDLYTANSDHVLRNVINTLKSLMQHKDWPVSIILSGMPEVRKMLNFDPQLARRFYPIELEPLSLAADEAMLKDMLSAYLRKAELRPSSDLLYTDFLMRLLHASAHEFGLVIELIIAAIEEAFIAPADELRSEHFACAFRRRTGCYDGMNPFVAPDYADIDPRKLFPDLQD